MAGIEDEVGQDERPETGKQVADCTTIVYNPNVTITGIPVEAERYLLGSKPVLA